MLRSRSTDMAQMGGLHGGHAQSRFAVEGRKELRGETNNVGHRVLAPQSFPLNCSVRDEDDDGEWLTRHYFSIKRGGGGRGGER